MNIMGVMLAISILPALGDDSYQRREWAGVTLHSFHLEAVPASLLGQFHPDLEIRMRCKKELSRWDPSLYYLSDLRTEINIYLARERCRRLGIPMMDPSGGKP